MDDNAVKALFLPFENGEVPHPADGESWLFLNAGLPLASDFRWQDHLECVQGFRPAFVQLKQSGYRVAPENRSFPCSGALVLLGKHRELNRRNVLAAIEQTLPGAAILVAGAKTSGVQSMRKEMSLLVSIGQSLSKYHAQVFWFSRPEKRVPVSLQPAVNIFVGEHGFETAPGMFSHKAIDAGSALLAAYLKDVKGKVADFGAGWGYLSAELLLKCKGVSSLDLYDADYAALEAARRNLQRLQTSTPLGFHWLDLSREPVPPVYDFVIMNPPFHTGRSADTGLGERFIAAASKALKLGGRMLMVANKQLSYENTLQTSFRMFERIGEDRQYKVIRAAK